jgi:hypothetical protein
VQRLYFALLFLAQICFSPAFSASCPRRFQAGFRALADEVALKLGKCNEDVEN